MLDSLLIEAWNATLEIGSLSVNQTRAPIPSAIDAALDVEDTDSGVPDNIIYSIAGLSSSSFIFALQGNNLIEPGVGTLTGTIGDAVDVFNAIDFGLVTSTLGKGIEVDPSRGAQLGTLFFTISRLSNPAIDPDPTPLPSQTRLC